MTKHRLPAFRTLSLACVLGLTGAACGQAPAPPAEPPAQAQSPQPPPDENPHWDYGQEHGPAQWGGLSPKFAACGEGRSQSPIDLAVSAPTPLPDPVVAHDPAALRIVHHEHKADVVNTGHSIQVDYPDADSLTVGPDAFALLQYHFHSPSEHTVQGRHAPVEMHLVHKSADGRLAVVGVLIEEGAANPAFEPIWANLPAQKGVESHLDHVKVDVDDLLPRDRGTWRYDGSLTTPPCSEGVKWFVLTKPITLSAEQIAKLRAVLQANNRPVQPLNDRVVVADRMDEKR